MNEDAELLNRYVTDHSERAFSDLIRRHVDLVYSAALRVVSGDVHRAEDVTQQVFSELARQAKRLRRHPTLSGWLYTTARWMALRATRTEQRRRAREQEAKVMNELLGETLPELDWDHLCPVLDDAMHALSEKDRLAVLLRFFQNKSLKEVGLAFGLNENAARKRVERSLDKLRVQLARKGVTSTAVALAVMLGSHAVTAAPSGFVATLTSAALASVATASGTTFSILKLMTMTKLKVSILSMVVVGVATSLVIQRQSQANLRQQDEALGRQSDQLAQLRAENERLAIRVGQASKSRPKELDELLRLRGEAELLRKQTNDLPALEEENRRLRAQFSRPSTKAKTALEKREEGIAKMIYAKDWMLAFVMYADKNQGRFPTNFDQALSFSPDRIKAETNITTDQFEIVYQGSWNSLTNAPSVIVVREKQARQSADGTWVRTYGFADGHSELHSAADGNFDAWEKQHLVLPSNR